MEPFSFASHAACSTRAIASSTAISLGLQHQLRLQADDFRAIPSHVALVREFGRFCQQFPRAARVAELEMRVGGQRQEHQGNAYVPLRALRFEPVVDKLQTEVRAARRDMRHTG